MDLAELLKAAPQSAQLAFFVIVGVAAGAAFFMRIRDGWRAGRDKPEESRSPIMAIQTASLADMSAVRDATAELSRNAVILKALADGLPEFSHLAPLVRDTNVKINEAVEALHRMEITAARREGIEDERARRRRDD